MRTPTQVEIVRTPVKFINPAIKLPPELTHGKLFVGWKLERNREGKEGKVPYNPITGRKAKINNPSTWNDFNTCHKAYRLGKYDGVSRALTTEDPYFCIDLDDCFGDDTYMVTKLASEIVDNFGSYTERSPSEKGLHVWGRGKKPGPRCRADGIEVYDHSRFITLTGQQYHGEKVEECQTQLDKLYEERLAKSDKEGHVDPENFVALETLSDEKVIDKVKEKQPALWDGDHSAYPSQSEADLALCGEIAYYCGPFPDRIDKVFRESGLYREKWDRKDYQKRTIQQAIRGRKTFYSELNPLKALNRNEDGDAELFRETFKNDLRYDHAEKEWYRWEDHHWRMDDLENVIRDLEAVINIYEKEKKRVAKLFAKAFAEGNKGAMKKWKRTLKELQGRIRALRTRARKKNVLALAACGLPLGLRGSEWDTHPWLLPCKNGVIDLRTGDLSEGNREYYIKTVAPTAWEGTSKEAPLWKQFLQEVFSWNGKLISYTQRLLGMALVGEVKEHIFPIFWGKGRNGKGTLLEAIAHVLGPLAGPVSGEMLLSQKWTRSSAAPSADIMALRGRRLAWASETEEGRELNISKVKWLVGGDTLAGRPPFGKRVIEFKPSHTLFLLTNNKPQASADDYALWDRISLVPFTKSFVDNPIYADEQKADPKLLDKLKLEAPGILTWLVQGCSAWQKSGLKPPEFVKMATEKYKAEEDILTMFLEECCKLGKGFKVRAGKLYRDYRYWAEGLGYEPWSNTAFGTKMARRFEKERSNKGIFYLGVTVKDD